MKIFKLLSTLSKDELKLLRKAVQSPLLNTNKSVIQLFEFLRKQHPNFDDSMAAKRKLFKKLFPKEAYYDHKLRRLFFELTKVIEQLLIQLHNEANPFERRKQLATIYNQRGIDTLFQKETNDLLTELEEHMPKSMHHYQEELQLLTNKYFHPSHDKYKLVDDTLKKADECLDTYFMLYKLRLTIALNGRTYLLNEKYDYRFLSSIKKERKQGFQADNLLIDLYIQAVDLMNDAKDVDFIQFEKELFEHLTQFELLDQQFLFDAGLNVAHRKRRESEEEQYQHVPFKWLQFGLKHNLLMESDILSEAKFANIIIGGCNAGKYDWVRNFMDTYQSNLKVTDLESTMLYYKGVVSFLQKDWDETLELLNLSAKKTIYPPRTRIMLIRTLFEKFLLDDSYLDSLLASLQAFEVYIRRDRYFAEGRLIGHLKFVQILRLLTKKIFAKQKKGVIEQWFNKATADNTPIQSKKWLIEKVANL